MQTDLSQYRWKDRLLVTFAPSVEAAARQGRPLAKDAAGRKERQLLRIVVLPGSTLVEGKPSTLDAAALRRRYRVRPGETRTLLVGKDGTVAFSTRKPVPLKTIFALIDAMPMRKAEMRKSGG